ncbi:hypothetical protein GP475_01065 [Corynebacterium poyangense]|uniref:Uncharacterized protein n=1 Tax=Corynebacterium poyangense TaxID=2684405 RepID=A0A7H0SLF2_9CORY|nr:hypothetical protein [Corynebacterium poyangense]MBZ8177470.1 hypothetical protein [Corynebacterium poyangense]QNQ89377.1 hypothetical protein GP475_01065 [Corynebacterium poyangense]
MGGFDMSRLPLGSEERQQLARHLAGKSDLRETYYLEVKSEFDLGNKNDQAKVAKFILGAANRDPEIASQYFDGHAIMVAGIGDNDIKGVTGTETKDLDKKVRSIVGASGDGPRYDIVSEEIDGKNVVFFIVGRPMNDIFPALANAGFNNLVKDGHIYHRTSGETNEMTGQELRQRIRALKTAGEVTDVALSKLGPITCGVVAEPLVRRRWNQAISQLRSSAPARSEVDGSLIDLAIRDSLVFAKDYYQRTPDEFHNRLDLLEQQDEQYLRSLRNAMSVERLTPLTIALTLKSKTHLKDVQMAIDIPKPVVILDPNDFSVEQTLRKLLPSKWTPIYDHGAHLADLSASSIFNHVGLPWSEIDQGRRRLTVHIPDVRYGEERVFQFEDVVLWAPDGLDCEIEFKWRLTAGNVPGAVEGVYVIQPPA